MHFPILSLAALTLALPSAYGQFIAPDEYCGNSKSCQDLCEKALYQPVADASQNQFVCGHVDEYTHIAMSCLGSDNENASKLSCNLVDTGKDSKHCDSSKLCSFQTTERQRFDKGCRYYKGTPAIERVDSRTAAERCEAA